MKKYLRKKSHPGLEITVESENCQTIQIFKKMEIQKNPKKNGIFSVILPEILPHPFSLGWSHQPGLKGPLAPHI
jgi:hypothetical protein